MQHMFQFPLKTTSAVHGHGDLLIGASIISLFETLDVFSINLVTRRRNEVSRRKLSRLSDVVRRRVNVTIKLKTFVSQYTNNWLLCNCRLTHD